MLRWGDVEVFSCSVVSFETYVGGYGILPYPRSHKIGFELAECRTLLHYTSIREKILHIYQLCCKSFIISKLKAGR